MRGVEGVPLDQMVAAAVQVTNADQVSLVMGGFHLGSASRSHVDEIIAALRDINVQRVAPSHCTGDAARRAFETAYGDAYLPVGLGATVIEGSS